MEAFWSHSGWWWIPVVCCHLGGFLGMAIYYLVVEHGWGTDTVEGEDKEENEIHLKIGV